MPQSDQASQTVPNQPLLAAIRELSGFVVSQVEELKTQLNGLSREPVAASEMATAIVEAPVVPAPSVPATTPATTLVSPASTVATTNTESEGRQTRNPIPSRPRITIEGPTPSQSAPARERPSSLSRTRGEEEPPAEAVAAAQSRPEDARQRLDALARLLDKKAKSQGSQPETPRESIA
ncbi:MAG: hypothetical protein U0794_14615 [Isosphaeraceae bacterium]